MLPDEIKKECDSIFDNIKNQKERLEHIQEICNHPTSFIGNFSYKVGCVNPALICSDCNKILKANAHV